VWGNPDAKEVPVLPDHPVLPILLATDLDASRTIYRDKLGLALIREDEGDRLVFNCSNGTQLVVTKSTVGTSDSQTQMRGGCPTSTRRSRTCEHAAYTSDLSTSTCRRSHPEEAAA
jgi:hypothetical protein